ncbi:MAG: right-handed parallel beta-helix repeat-containing protein [Planctomycetota bacterium]
MTLPIRAALAVAVLAAGLVGQTILNVPSSAYPTIQSAISASANGDVVQVAAGTYLERIDFQGKRIGVIGAGRATTILDGSGSPGIVVKMINNEGLGTRLVGFTITGGTGQIGVAFALGSWGTVGGGLCIARGPQSQPSGPSLTLDPVLVRDCRFIGNTAMAGAGVCVTGSEAAVEFEDCEFVSNVCYSGDPFGPEERGGGLLANAKSVVLRRCLFEGNQAEMGGGIWSNLNTLFRMEDCTVQDNEAWSPTTTPIDGSAGALVRAELIDIRRCRFRRNVSSNLYGGLNVVRLTTAFPTGTATVADCEFVDNTARRYSGLAFAANGVVAYCTVTGNVDTAAEVGSAPAMVQSGFGGLPTTVVENTIVRGNVGGELAFFAGLGLLPQVAHCNIGGGLVGGTAIVDVDPMFVDPASGDYRLAFGSPMVDAAVDSPNTLAIATDLSGRNRRLFGGPDIGAHESDDVAYDPSSAGTLLDPATGLPHPVLTVNWSDGGADRRVDVPLQTPWSVNFLSPSFLAASPGFAIFGAIGEPTAATVTTLPFGLGTMSFLPCPLLPTAPELFTLASTVGGLPCGSALPAAPAPIWTTPAIPGLGGEADIAFQALVLDGAGNVSVSNLVIARFR